MSRFLVEIEAVKGTCKRGYTQGRKVVFNGFDTPDSFCGGAYTVLYPVLTALHYGGSFSDEKDPLCRTNIACPEGGNVIFRVSLVE